MIVVNVELWPGGRREMARHLGTAAIVNDATGTLQTGNYNVRIGNFYEENPYALLADRGVWKRGRVENFPRKQQGPWDLLGRALNNILGRRLDVESDK